MHMRKDTKKILVVDDDPKHLQTTKELLEMAGYEVATQDSAFGTTEIINTLKPDLVLLDVNMPALSGERLCSLIRSRVGIERTTILFFSSNDEDSLRQAVRRHGADGYVCKGDVAGLRHKIARALAA
jgi:CheY-like chemotaxis protein